MRPLGERIGIMQGRLVPSATGELDCSPGARWREEFSIAATLELNHIELVAERVMDSSNPIWSVDGRRDIAAAARETDVRVASICLNEPVTTPFDDEAFARDLATRVAPVVDALNATIVVLPLLDASDLNALDWAGAARSVRIVTDQLVPQGARLALELGVAATDSLRFLDAVGSSGVGICYDVGNATAAGFDAAAELRLLGDRVWHVHAKDKNAARENVRFGTGDVPFAAVLRTLDEQGFDGLVTMEATRGDDPIVTAGEHRAFLLSMEATRPNPVERP
ncbi:MAG: L-ribulose-5-phosphate 3-epimerase [Acidimicrobiaceae bacterium]